MDLLDEGLERLAKLCRKYSRLQQRRSGTLGKRFRSGKLFRRHDRFIPFNRRSDLAKRPRMAAATGRKGASPIAEELLQRIGRGIPRVDRPLLGGRGERAGLGIRLLDRVDRDRTVGLRVARVLADLR